MSRSLDPFDIEWSEPDPLGRDVIMSKSVIRWREASGKHPFPPERLEPCEAREVISDPDRIDESASHETRDIYYKVYENEENPYARVVVDFKDNENRGIAISWSRYRHPVSSYGAKWRKEGT